MHLAIKFRFVSLWFGHTIISDNVHFVGIHYLSCICAFMIILAKLIFG